MGLRHFRLLGGQHVEGDKTYKKGDLVPSTTDLVTRFKGKFERIFSQEQLEGIATAPSQPIIPSPKEEVEEETISTPSEEVEEVDDIEDIDEVEEVEDTPEYGPDVTDQFSTAVKAGYCVYEPTKHWFIIIDPNEDDPADAVMNESKLRRKNVDGFLAKLKG